MKVALVVPGGVDRSGEVRVVPALLWLIERLARRHEMHVFALYQEPKPTTYPLLGATVHNIGARPVGTRAILGIVAEHRRGRFDVIHALWATPAGMIAALAGEALGRPVLLHLGGGELVSMPEIDYGGRLTRGGRIAVRLALGGAAIVTAASAPLLEEAAALGRQARRLPLGVDLARWPAREPRRRDPRLPAKLLHVGSLNRVKDQRTLLAAVADVARRGLACELDVVGEDTLDGAIQRAAAELESGVLVRFRGFLTHRDLRPLFEAADVLVVSSRHEAGPVVMLEGAVAGVPTVGTAVGHVREWAPDAAVAVPVDDAATLGREAHRLLVDEERRLSIAKGAYCRALEYDADWTANQVESIYSELTMGEVRV